ncbi:hypothetical protein GCM10025868_31990 [Angustibacter aerolatus]|uniref:Glycosyl hydrolase family 13 catalytic domain-containing protein n=1 Tax=Angustibacter aerolatus TaxID=1162965 RepID=A0ABQ6JLE2_9ACTN|nr:hypothetical protein GCM10025868_31990 [Angustibacter aerolatus]
MHQFAQDSHLLEKGLRNYWGYNSIAFLAPHNEYSAAGDDGGQVDEFKAMVKALHAAGLEVWLDVVYNHTAEGNHMGPTLSLKGIDNPSYYRLVDDERAAYFDTTGTGNSLNVSHPAALQVILDSLRYWVTEMHVDGFRFDLATTLTRQGGEADVHSAFLDIVHQDPVLSRVKLVAEPWDTAGYQVGGFPARWSEWNGKFRDDVRDFWRGTEGALGEIAQRIAGSADVYQADGRSPLSSVNFVTAHDGFTLADLTAYDDKHNEANGEDNQDGESDNRSWGCGAEGDTDDEGVLALRGRQRRNLLTTLLLSSGVPMLLGGDELGRTQGGNNNAYCQDDEIAWFDWEAVGSAEHQEPAGVHPAGSSRCARSTTRCGPSGTATATAASGSCGPTAPTWRSPTGPTRATRRSPWCSPATRPRSCCCSTPPTASWSSRSRRTWAAGAGARACRATPSRRSPSASRRCWSATTR